MQNTYQHLLQSNRNASPLSTDFPAIAPFLADIDTSHGRGRVLYREDTSPAVLGLAARYVGAGFPRSGAHFAPTHAFLATWEQVGAYEEATRWAPPSGEVSDQGCLLGLCANRGMGLNSGLEPREIGRASCRERVSSPV